MSRTDKFLNNYIIFVAMAIIFFCTLLLFPIPVHKVNNACCSSDICAKERHHEKSADFTNKQLQAWYDGLNEDYFFNRLPKAVVQWGDLTANTPPAMGLTTYFSNGTWIITIDRSTNPTPSVIEMTIAHETCHVATYTVDLNHGSKFQNCMVNLATHGAFEGIW